MGNRNAIRRKADVEIRWNRREAVPALNVKDYASYATLRDRLMAEHGCDEAVAGKAIEYAIDSARERFWEDANNYALEVFGSHVKVWSDGRCGGWLIVEGLPPVAEWDAVALGRWKVYAARIDRLMDGLRNNLEEDIEANEWCKPYAERYNFIGTPNGPVCVADLNAARKAGADAAEREFLAGVSK